MISPRCFAVMTVVWCAWIPGSSSKETAEYSREPDDVRAQRLLRKDGEPLMLLWGGDIPKAFGNRTCWKSTKTGWGPRGMMVHSLESSCIGESSSQPEDAQKFQTHLTLRRQGENAILQVATDANTNLTKLFTGDYDILYVDERCIILRPKASDGNGLCTAWVLASTVQFRHRKCRQAFYAKCSSDKQCK
ncbi:uncharacterized protein LOC144110869 [Amblyomma americanum]